MKLSISNIAWDTVYDTEMYQYIQECGFSALEIAPTKWIGQSPYEDLIKVKNTYYTFKKQYKLDIVSIQSMWYGRDEQLFTSKEDYQVLLEYTKKAILFAETIKCRNIVFGNPKNRIIDTGFDMDIAIRFFKDIGDFAHKHNTCIGMEANPVIYGTNFINTTSEAILLIKLVNSLGFKLNLDIGTMIINGEDPSILQDNIELINHVHISEPYLEPIIPREIHKDIFKILRRKYNNYISIEMRSVNNVAQVKEIMSYIKQL